MNDEKIIMYALKDIYQSGECVINIGEQYAIEYDLNYEKTNITYIFNLNGEFIGQTSEKLFGSLEECRLNKLNIIFDDEE